MPFDRLLGGVVGLGIADGMAPHGRVSDALHKNMGFDLAYGTPELQLCRVRVRMAYYTSVELARTELALDAAIASLSTSSQSP